jgi:light-regulated signal transduction histidine kinase (bacteriophytochrome)
LEETNAKLSQEVAQRTQAQEEISWLNLDLSARNQAMDKVNRELESFCYSVSHDLRAPLRHLNSFSAMLLEDFHAQLNEQGQHCLERIAVASQKMQGLIDDLLLLSRVGQTELHMGKVDLSKLGREVAAMLQETEPERQPTISVADDLITHGDLGLLRQALQNLLGNAWKYSARQSAAVIEFGSTTVDTQQVFYVRDNGVGFDMAYAEKLFSPFHRLHGTEFAGNGIGLATVQRIIHRHLGTIWAEAALNQGATFYFTLPG